MTAMACCPYCGEPWHEPRKCYWFGRRADIEAGRRPLTKHPLSFDPLYRSPRPFPAAAMRWDWEPQ